MKREAGALHKSVNKPGAAPATVNELKVCKLPLCIDMGRRRSGNFHSWVRRPAWKCVLASAEGGAPEGKFSLSLPVFILRTCFNKHSLVSS